MIGFRLIVLLHSSAFLLGVSVRASSAPPHHAPHPVSNATTRPLTSAPRDTCLENGHAETWRKEAIAILWRERSRMAKTPLVRVNAVPGVELHFKNESAAPTASLKHRYSWSLVVWALLDGYIHPRTVVYEASSGNTARSEAYMLSLIGIRFVAVIPEGTEATKVEAIERAGGVVHRVPHGDLLGAAAREAHNDPNGFFINQFGNSGRSLDIHESGNFDLESVNVFHEIVSQLRDTPPTHAVLSASTVFGGTISSVGRYVKKYGLNTEVVLADTEFSAYYDHLVSGRFSNARDDPKPLWVEPGMASTGFGWAGPLIAGQTYSLVPAVVDRALKIPDLASVASMHLLRRRFGVDGGPSTGVSFAGALKLAAAHFAGRNSLAHKQATIVVLLADPGANYASSYYNESWVDAAFRRNGGMSGVRCWLRVLEQWLDRRTLLGVDEKLFCANDADDPLERGVTECSSRALNEQQHASSYR